MSNQRSVRFEIIQPGVSISSRHSTNGTLGLIVFDIENDYQPCILSNWHVLAKSTFIPGTSFKAGRPIYQPGRLIAGRRKSNIVGKLVRYDRSTDSAIAKIVRRSFILNQFESNKIISKVRLPQINDVVEKSGARTGITKGKITEIRGNQVKIKSINDGNPEDIEISDGGDSGAIWYDPKTLEGIVLHNSGESKDEPSSEFAKGFILKTVIERLNVSLSENE